MKEKLDRRKAHQKYLIDGVQVPGYSSVANELSKPFLKIWANREGLAGRDIQKDKEATDIGSICHFLIDCRLNNNEPDLSDYAQTDIDKAQIAFNAYLELEKQNPIELIKNEIQLVSRIYRYGGTPDLYCRLNNKLTLVDFKTSKAYYPDMKIQIAAYKQLLIENGYDVEQAFIWRIDKETGSFENIKVELTKEWDLFMALRRVYDLRKELKI